MKIKEVISIIGASRYSSFIKCIRVAMENNFPIKVVFYFPNNRLIVVNTDGSHVKTLTINDAAGENHIYNLSGNLSTLRLEITACLEEYFKNI